jgi:hypothetical protein
MVLHDCQALSLSVGASSVSPLLFIFVLMQRPASFVHL